MSTSVASITPQSAPRDPQALMKMGIFQLRLLIEKLGGLGNEQEKVAFAKMNTDEKVNLALQLLAHFDKTNGGAPAHTNGVTPGTMVLPAPTQVMQVPAMEVNPAALAAAAAATAPQPVRRSPVTSAGPAAAPPAADLGGEVLNALSRIISQNEETNTMIAGAMKELLGEVKAVATSNQGLNETYKAVFGALQSVDKSLQSVQLQSKLSMALVLPLAEQVLGASREDVLGATLGDVDSIQAMLTQMLTPGKAG